MSEPLTPYSDDNVEVSPNRRSKLRCECGSDRPTLWLLTIGDHAPRECCYDCVGQAWRNATEGGFLSGRDRDAWVRKAQ